MNQIVRSCHHSSLKKPVGSHSGQFGSDALFEILLSFDVKLFVARVMYTYGVVTAHILVIPSPVEGSSFFVARLMELMRHFCLAE